MKPLPDPQPPVTRRDHQLRWPYHVFSHSLLDVELLLAERGVVVSYETVQEVRCEFRLPPVPPPAAPAGQSLVNDVIDGSAAVATVSVLGR